MPASTGPRFEVESKGELHFVDVANWRQDGEDVVFYDVATGANGERVEREVRRFEGLDGRGNVKRVEP